MSSKKDKKRSLSTIIALILAGEVIFFLPFVLARIFRPTLLIVFDITNFELGLCFSTYGIVAVLSYFLGGPLADRYPARDLIAAGLWTTALGGILLYTIPSVKIMTILWGFWGMTTILLFWAALIKATREWGGHDFQGRAFGLLEGGRGLTAALLASLSLVIFSVIMPDASDALLDEKRIKSFKAVILTTTAITFVIGLLVLLLIPKKISEEDEIDESPGLLRMIDLIKQPKIWMQGLIIVCAYVGYKITDDYSLYANQVLDFDEEQSAAVGTGAMWMRPVCAVIAGILADRLGGTKVITWCFIVMAIGGLAIFSGVLDSIAILALIVLASTLVGIYGIRGIYFAVMEEAKIPLVATGTAVGIMSVLGYTPDIFMSPLMGHLLDNYPGAEGHHYVFAVLLAFSILGLIVSLFFRKLVVSDFKS